VDWDEERESPAKNDAGGQPARVSIRTTAIRGVVGAARRGCSLERMMREPSVPLLRFSFGAGT